MSRFLVAGLTQMETIVKVERIPVTYAGITSSPDTIYTAVGGDGYNEAQALKWLGNEVDFLTMVGKGAGVNVINPPESEVRLATDYVLPRLSAMPAAVIFCAPDRKQQIFEDRKDEGETPYDLDLFRERAAVCNRVVLQNTAFCVPFIEEAGKAGRPIAVNIRDFSTETEAFHARFLKAADIIYVSDDDVEGDAFAFVKRLADTYGPEVIILGQGAEGVILYARTEDVLIHYNTVKTNKTVNTVGAGNALLSCFLHYYEITGSPVYAIKNALLFASYKVGFLGTSRGFMSVSQMEQWRSLIWKDERWDLE